MHTAQESANSKRIAEFRQVIATAKAEREARDACRAKAKELIPQHRQLIEQLRALKAEAQAKRAEAAKVGATASYARLREEFERLEWAVQTEASPREEKRLSKKAKEMRAELAKSKEADKYFTELKELNTKIYALERQANDVGRQIAMLNSEGDGHHKSSVDASKKADFLSKEIGKGVEDAQVEREKLGAELKARNEARDAARKEEEHQHRSEESVKNAKLSDVKKRIRAKAEEIRKRLMAGEKITTQEFLVLKEAEE